MCAKHVQLLHVNLRKYRYSTHCEHKEITKTPSNAQTVPS